MHGSIGGRWGNGTTLWGPLVPGWCAERRHHDGPIGTSTAAGGDLGWAQAAKLFEMTRLDTVVTVQRET